MGADSEQGKKEIIWSGFIQDANERRRIAVVAKEAPKPIRREILVSLVNEYLGEMG